ncbi:hypothetical protein A9A89_0246 [Bifidobacterium psychraerophilum DSM 22366]|nr:hypothetical protein A9A89_0246 [Bifidobacterium psychraerophilum DSM 22366]
MTFVIHSSGNLPLLSSPPATCALGWPDAEDVRWCEASGLHPRAVLDGIVDGGIERETMESVPGMEVPCCELCSNSWYG